MVKDVVQFASDADPLLAGAPSRFVFAASLRVERPLLDLFQVGPAAAHGLAKDEAGDQPSGEPQRGDEVDHVTSPKDDADRQESADDGDDRGGSRSPVTGVGDRIERDADGDRAQPGWVIEEVVGEGRDHRTDQG